MGRSFSTTKELQLSLSKKVVNPESLTRIKTKAKSRIISRGLGVLQNKTRRVIDPNQHVSQEKKSVVRDWCSNTTVKHLTAHSSRNLRPISIFVSKSSQMESFSRKFKSPLTNKHNLFKNCKCR